MKWIIIKVSKNKNYKMDLLYKTSKIIMEC